MSDFGDTWPGETDCGDERRELNDEIERLRAALAESEKANVCNIAYAKDLGSRLAEAEREGNEARRSAKLWEARMHNTEASHRKVLTRAERAEAALSAWLLDYKAVHEIGELRQLRAERDKALDRLCTSPGEGNLVAAATDMTANYVEANRRAERAEVALKEQLETKKWYTDRYERAEAERDKALEKWRIGEATIKHECEHVFRPRVVQYDEVGATEMMLEDTLIIWQPWGPYKGHAVDLGYTEDGKLVGIKIWDRVAERTATAAEK